MNSQDLFIAIEQLKAEGIPSRVCVIVRTALDVRLVQRTIALSPSGLAGVDVWTWRDLANEVLEVLSDSSTQGASVRQVAELGVAPALRDLDNSTPATWLLKSSGHTDSIYRLARTFIKASSAISNIDQVLPVRDLELIASAVENNLENEGLLLLGRALIDAAALLDAGSKSSISRLIPSAIALGDIELLSMSERRLRGALIACVPSAVVSPAGSGNLGARATRSVIAPNPLIEARVVATQVHDWLAAGVPPSRIAVVTPQQAGFQAVLSNLFEGLGIEHWTGMSQGSLASTYAAHVIGSLAKSLDSMSACTTCSGGGSLNEVGATTEHDCKGNFEYVAEVINATFGGWERSGVILQSGSELNLQYGLGNWATLLRWHLGEEEALVEVTARNVRERAADPESERPRGVVIRVSDSSELLDQLRPGLEALLDILSPAGTGELPSFLQRCELLIKQAKLNDRPLKSVGIIIEALGGGAVGGARRLDSMVNQVVRRPTSNIDTVGEGVGVYSVSQISSISCTHLVWCGLAEGAAPILTKPDPLVQGDAEAQVALERSNSVTAHELVESAEQSLITVSRVALGSREALIASRWFMQWSGAQGSGASEIMKARSLESIEVIDSSLAGVALYPVPADQPRQGFDSAARTLLDSRVALGSPAASEFDGLLGSFPIDAGSRPLSWLSASPMRRANLKGETGSTEPAPVSPSALSTFITCPRQFFYKKIVGLRAGEQPSLDVDVPANTWGTFVHAALEEGFEDLISMNSSDRVAALTGILQKRVSGYLPFYAGSKQQLTSRIKGQAAAINNTIKWSELSSRSDFESEKYLKADFDGITIAGYADFAWPNFVADAKTGKKKTGAELLRDRVQVQAYSAILAKDSNQSVAGELWYLSPKDPSVVSTGVAGEPEKETPMFLKVIDSLRCAVDQGAFPAVGENTGELGSTCLYCDFNKICRTDVHDRWEELDRNGDFSQVHPIEEPVLAKAVKGKDA